MKPLVVLLSVAAFAMAKPSALLASGIVSAPVIAAEGPAAVSRQTRIDIRTSPSVVVTAPVTRTVIAQPTLLRTPVLAPAAVPVITNTLLSSGPLGYGALEVNTVLRSGPGWGIGLPTMANTLGAGIINGGMVTPGLSIV